MQQFQKEREEEFRNQSEKINSRVAWWSLIQTVLANHESNLKFLARKKKMFSSFS